MTRSSICLKLSCIMMCPKNRCAPLDELWCTANVNNQLGDMMR